MKPLLVIEPRQPSQHKWKIGTFDIETRPVGEESSLLAPFCMAATCRDADGKTVEYFHYPLLLLQYLLSYKDEYRWFCHNGGGFDFKYLICDGLCQAWLADAGYRVDIIGGDIVKALMFRKGRKVTFLCDSFKLMPVSLAKLCADLKVETAKGFIDFDSESFDPDNRQHIEYLRDDVISLWQVMDIYRDTINTEFGQEIRCTASSTSFVCWQGMLEQQVFHHADMVNEFARKAYYGGRTECFYQQRVNNVAYIDVNSLYAYIMLEYGALEKPCYTRELSGPGFYRVNAEVPHDLKFGPLPFRKPDGSGVIFPVGEFSTYASSLEIEIALDMGCGVEIEEGYAFDEWNTDIFKPFIGKCMELRQRDYNGALGITAKFLQNNLYGFFGMNPERLEVIYSMELPEVDDSEEGYDPLIDDLTGLQVEGLWQRKIHRETINCIPAFAAWITSAARAYLLRAMLAEEAAGNRVVYCDTDSIILSGQPVSRIAEGEYGAFKLEYTIDTFLGITAKTYIHRQAGRYSEEQLLGLTAEKLKGLAKKGVWVDPESGDLYTMKCKGIPSVKLQPDMFDRALAGQPTTVEFTQLHNLNRVLKSGLRGREDSFRSVPTVNSLTSRRRGNDGKTFPILLSGNEKG